VETAAGAQGFGYDPLFVPRGFDRTFAELSAEEKNALSHRGLALAAVREVLEANA
jgi:XTP/dITP diphosphohydrolase